MANSHFTLLRYIRKLAPPDNECATDRDLLIRFCNGEDSAFEILVKRHGPMVWQACAHVLSGNESAEDAFQATFLVLAKKAGSLAWRESIAGWIYRVAYRLSVRAKLAQVRRRKYENKPMELPTDDPLENISLREARVILVEELNRLPEEARAALVLYYLEDTSQADAAKLMACSLRTFTRRLDRGKKLLHARMVRRGLTLSAIISVEQLAAPYVHPALSAAAIRTSLAFVQQAGEPIATSVLTLAKWSLLDITLNRLKIGMVVAAAVALLVVGTGLAGRQMLKAGQDPGTLIVNATLSPSAPPVLRVLQPPPSRDTGDIRIEVTGRVLDPGGRPLAGAKLYTGYSIRHDLRSRAIFRLPADLKLQQPSYPVRATSGPDGRFQFEFATSELDALRLDECQPTVIAVGSGYGPDWIGIPFPGNSEPSSKPFESNLRLVEDIPLKGRIVDADHRPVVGARIRVHDLISNSEANLERFRRDSSISLPSPCTLRGSIPGQLQDVRTDADGSFQLEGLGRGRIVQLALDGPGICSSHFEAETSPTLATPLEYVARPCKSLRGVVRDLENGNPIAGVTLRHFDGVEDVDATTDRAGQFEIPGFNFSGEVLAQPQTGLPYFAASARLPDALSPADTVNFLLVRGIVLSGRVVDAATQKPPRTAVVEYYPLEPNDHAAKLNVGVRQAASSSVVLPDGSYTLVVLPGPGLLAVAAAPRNCYAVGRFDEQEFARLFPPGLMRGGIERPWLRLGPDLATVLNRDKYQAYRFINPVEGAEPASIDLHVQPGRLLQGTVTGPDGRPLTGAMVVGITAMPDYQLLESASFTVTGLDPRKLRKLHFAHKEKNLGKVVTVSGDELGPLSVQLEPCGTVHGRVIDADRKPVPHLRIRFRGAPRGMYPDVEVDTDARGFFRAALVPGQEYSLVFNLRGVREYGEVAVGSAKDNDLGDLVIDDRGTLEN